MYDNITCTINLILKQLIVAKYSKKTEEKIEVVMREFKEGELKSGKGGKGGTVTSRKQAIAIAINEARHARLKVSAEKKP